MEISQQIKMEENNPTAEQLKKDITTSTLSMAVLMDFNNEMKELKTHPLKNFIVPLRLIKAYYKIEKILNLKK
jgi:hypothetical protein